MKRKIAIQLAIVAGWEDNKSELIRLRVEAPVSWQALLDAYEFPLYNVMPVHYT